jgi:hypothetical protein
MSLVHRSPFQQPRCTTCFRELPLFLLRPQLLILV